MDLFLDTSATVPLLLVEPHSAAAVTRWTSARRHWAWEWMRVEAEAALVRRAAGPEAWATWQRLSARIRWIDSTRSLVDDLLLFNRSLGLRAADAGHLLVFQKATAGLPELALATFDLEQVAAARRLGLRLAD